MSSSIPKLPEITYFLEQNNVYVGSTINGTPEGQGTLTLPSQGKTLKGLFRDGEFPKGTLVFESGLTFDGTFSEDQPIGVGIFTIPDVMEILLRFDVSHRISNSCVHIKFGDGESFKGVWNQHGFQIKGVFKYLQKNNTFKSEELQINGFKGLDNI